MALSDHAILARTNAQLGVFENLCIERKIKYFLLGKSGMWRQPEVQSVVRLANFLLGTKPAEGYLQDKVVPLRPIYSVEASIAVKSIIDRAQLEALYGSEDFSDDENFAIMNLRTLVKIAARFKTLGEFCTHARKAEHASKKSKDAVVLGTIHSAKGLEFQNVYVIGVQEGIIPHEKNSDPDEEKRVFYVAISRPAKYLRISFCGAPSPYIKPDLTPEIVAQMRGQAQKVEVLEAQLQLL
jgi:DNA helicase-2/ATP-dependent DNA helicase PcrA